MQYKAVCVLCGTSLAESCTTAFCCALLNTVLLRIIAEKWKSKEIYLELNEGTTTQRIKGKIKQNPFIYLCSRSKWKNWVSFFIKFRNTSVIFFFLMKRCLIFPAFSKRAGLDIWKERLFLFNLRNFKRVTCFSIQFQYCTESRSMSSLCLTPVNLVLVCLHKALESN